MKISYAILTHNEGKYIETLLSYLVTHKQPQDEIVVVDDYSTDVHSKAILEEHEAMELITLYRRELNKDFAAQKNYLTDQCTGDFIFQIDADELPTDFFMENIHSILESNPTVDVMLVPRINIVNGLTQEHINKWGWRVNEKGWINFPDPQWRIYKNIPSIRWQGKVHERLSGFKQYSFLPTDEEYCLIHDKTIDRQQLQNEFYERI